jgi:predicted esterase
MTLLFGYGRTRAVQPEGDVIRYFEPAGIKPGLMSVFIYRPKTWHQQGGRILVVLHGADRDGRVMREAWRLAADADNALLIAPEFSEAQFPGPRWFNLGNAVDDNGRLSPREFWTFGALDRAVDAVRAAIGATTERFSLYGFSAGAQFVHRYLLLTGAPRVDQIVASSAGWYTLPDPEQNFPCGLRGVTADPSLIRVSLRREVVIHVGQRDTDSSDYFGTVRNGTCVTRQGANRLERGRFFIEAARKEAWRLDVPFHWRFVEARGVGHDREDMADDALRTVLVHATR